MTPSKEKRPDISGPAERVAPWVLLGLIALAYANSLDGSFQFDDWNVVVDARGVRSLADWWAAMPGMRPLLKLSYAINAMADRGPAGYRLVNIAVHVGNAWMAAWLLHTLGRTAAPAHEASTHAAWAAWIAALVFALHPVQTEAVTYISGRSTSLCALFALASIALWVHGQLTREAGRASQAGSLLAFAMALGCKEFAVVVPLVLVGCARMLPDEVIARRRPWSATRWHWLVVTAALALALALPRYRTLFAVSLEIRGVLSNLLAQVDGIAWLAGQLLCWSRLNADPGLAAVAGPTPRIIVIAVLMGLLAVLAFLAWRRESRAGFALLWFLAWLLPTNSVLARLDVANDRQLYLAMLGPAWMAGLVVARTAGAMGRKSAEAAVVVMALALLAGTHIRNRVYATETTFWQDVVEKSPGNARAHSNLGMARALACDVERAQSEFQAALALEPGDTRTQINLALLRDRALPGMPTDCLR